RVSGSPEARARSHARAPVSGRGLLGSEGAKQGGRTAPNRCWRSARQERSSPAVGRGALGTRALPGGSATIPRAIQVRSRESKGLEWARRELRRTGEPKLRGSGETCAGIRLLARFSG